jgi:hypothetical protein
MKFFNINNSIFNQEKVVAIHQRKEKVEVERTVVVVIVNDGNNVEQHTVLLPEGKQLSDFVDSNQLNNN